jgi:glutaredoxin 3
MQRKPDIRLYGTRTCSYCLAARMLLKKKGADFEDIAVDNDPARRQEMQALGGGRTVPQIFIDDRPIGGFDELNALQQSGELDRLLGESADPQD